MSLSLAMSIGVVAVAALVLAVVLIAWRKKRNRLNDELLSEMATHLWSLPRISSPCEVTGSLNPENHAASSLRQQPDSTTGGTPVSDKEPGAVFDRITARGKEAQTAPEATQPDECAHGVVCPSEGSDGLFAKYREPCLRSRVMGRHHLLWEVVGAEPAIQRLEPPESLTVELPIDTPREPSSQSVREEPNKDIEAGVDGEASKLVQQARGQLESEVLSALRAFSQEVETRLRTLGEGLVSSWVGKLEAEMAEQTQRLINELRDGHHPSILSVSAELDERVKKQLDAAGSGFVEQTRRRLQSEVFSALETFSLEVGTRLRTLEEEQLQQSIGKLRAEITTQLQEQLGNIQEAVSDARQQVSLMAARVTPLLDNKELILRSALASDRDLKEYADAAAGRIDAAAKTAVDKLCAFEDRVAVRLGEAMEALRKASDDVTVSSAARLEGQLTGTTERMSEELRALQTRLVDQAKEQLGAAIQAPLESITRKAEAITEECRHQLGKMLDESGRQGVQELNANCRKSLESQRESLRRSLDEQHAASQTSLESFKREAQAIIEEWRARLRQEADVAVAASSPKFGTEHESPLRKPREPLVKPMGLYHVTTSARSAELARSHPGRRFEAPLQAALRAAVWLLPITPVILFVILSVRPEIHLRTDPPVEFLEGLQDLSAAERTTEERLARAYWDSAVRYVQPKYQVGTTLPNEPLPEFNAGRTGARPETSRNISDARIRYWRRLREVWTLPRAWEKSYVWDTGWIDMSLATLQRAGRQLVDGAR